MTYGLFLCVHGNVHFCGPRCLLHLDRELAIDFHRHLSFAVQRKRSLIMYSQLPVRKCNTNSFFWNIYYTLKTKVWKKKLTTSINS